MSSYELNLLAYYKIQIGDSAGQLISDLFVHNDNLIFLSYCGRFFNTSIVIALLRIQFFCYPNCGCLFIGDFVVN